MSEKIRIMIVEDEPIVALDLKKTLEKLNYSVAGSARNGEAAVKKAKALHPDLILMDIMLGKGINGIQAAASIKKDLNIPIIFCTAYADKETIENAKITEPFGYLIKPFDEKMLYAVIEMALYKHRIESNLQESEERYRILVENSPYAVIIHDNLEIIYLNSAAAALFGTTDKSDLIGTSIYEFIHPSFQNIERDRINSLKLNSKPQSIEEKILRLNGEVIDAEIYSSLIEFNGKAAVQMVIKDLSEVKKKEKILQVTLKILYSAQITDSLEQLFSLLYKTLRAIFPLKNFLTALYEKSTAQISYPYAQVESDLHQQNELDDLLVKTTAEKNITHSFDKDELKKMGSDNSVKCNIPFYWFGVPLQINDKLTGVLIIKAADESEIPDENIKELIEIVAYPVSTAIERRIIEEERKNNNRYLKDLNETKDKFFSIISHDLKSPFNSLLGFSEILQTEYDKLSEAERKDYISSLYESMNNVYNLMHNLLEFSRFRSGGFEFNPKELNLSFTIEENIRLLSGTAAKKKISVETKYQTKPMIFADSNMLNSIIQNLLTNSIKFTRRNGRVIISVNESNGFAEVSVIDNGVGMSKEILSNLFKLDSKQSQPGTENEPGTGMGLLITKEFVEKNGGRIKVQSSPEKGSTFTFTIPLASRAF